MTKNAAAKREGIRLCDWQDKERNRNKRLFVFKVFALVIFLMASVAVWAYSLTPADKSQVQTEKIQDIIDDILPPKPNPDNPPPVIKPGDESKPPVVAEKPHRLTYMQVRKGIGHFSAFLCIGIAGGTTFFLWFRKKYVGIPLCVLAGFSVAGISEMLQLPIFTRGRFCSINDVTLDFSGYLLGVALAVVFLAIATIVFDRYHRKVLVLPNLVLPSVLPDVE